MNYDLAIFGFLGGLFLSMALLLELGRRFGRRALAAESADATSGLGPLEGAIFGLLGLLVAFTFSGAASRFDLRRQLIVQEANAIGTAYLRLDLLPDASQPALRKNFRDYVDARVRAYQLIPDLAAANVEFAKASTLQDGIWRLAVAASRGDAQPARLVLPALNEMFDITTTRAVAAETHMPAIIFGMLGVLALVCSFLAGAAMAKSPQSGFLRNIAFPLALVATLYVILDLEFPRLGFIRIDSVDQALVDVRRSMDAP